MSRQANQLLGWILIALSAFVFTGVFAVGVPRLLAPEIVAEPDVFSVADSNLPTPVVTQPIATVELPTPIPPTALPPTALPPTEIPPTDVPPTIAPAADDNAAAASSLAPTDVPQADIPPTEAVEIEADVVEEADVAEEAVSAESQELSVWALEDAGLFYGAGGTGGQIGYFVPAGRMATALGRSEDQQWLHIRMELGTEGWVFADLMTFEDASISSLPVSDFVSSETQPEAVAVVPPTSVPPTVAPPTAIPPTVAVPTAAPVQQAQPSPTFPPPPPTQAPQVQPTPVPAQVFPTPVPTQAPQVQPTSEPDTANAGPTSNAIAWWDIEPGTSRATGNGTWQVDVVLRVPTSFQYTFDMAYLWRVNLRDRNLDGDDYYVLSLSGMACGQSVSDPLVVRQENVPMRVVNEFSVAEGPIFISPPC